MALINDVALTDDVTLTDEVSQFHWREFLCTVDWWRGSMLVDQTLRIRYMHIHMIIFNQTESLFKPVDYLNHVVPRTVDWWRGAILSVQTVFDTMDMIYSMYL